MHPQNQTFPPFFRLILTGSALGLMLLGGAHAASSKAAPVVDLLTDEEAGDSSAVPADSTESDAAERPLPASEPGLNVAAVEREALVRHPIR
jgi:hypothetical protein